MKRELLIGPGVRGWGPRRWFAATVGAVASAAMIGIPTGIIETPYYHRMTPVLWWNYPVWGATALLSGLLLATYVNQPSPIQTQQKKAITGGLLSFFAVGCPICNKLVVVAIGMSGALTYFAPIQPILAVLSVTLLAEALRRRLRTEASCPVAAGTPAG